MQLSATCKTNRATNHFQWQSTQYLKAKHTIFKSTQYLQHILVFALVGTVHQVCQIFVEIFFISNNMR